LRTVRTTVRTGGSATLAPMFASMTVFRAQQRLSLLKHTRAQAENRDASLFHVRRFFDGSALAAQHARGVLETSVDIASQRDAVIVAVAQQRTRPSNRCCPDRSVDTELLAWRKEHN
jgi:hypothetical protein